jgi:hypothetical protein
MTRVGSQRHKKKKLSLLSACLGISENKRNNEECCCVCKVIEITVRVYLFFYADTCVR